MNKWISFFQSIFSVCFRKNALWMFVSYARIERFFFGWDGWARCMRNGNKSYILYLLKRALVSWSPTASLLFPSSCLCLLVLYTKEAYPIAMPVFPSSSQSTQQKKVPKTDNPRKNRGLDRRSKILQARCTFVWYYGAKEAKKSSNPHSPIETICEEKRKRVVCFFFFFMGGLVSVCCVFNPSVLFVLPKPPFLLILFCIKQTVITFKTHSSNQKLRLFGG